MKQVRYHIPRKRNIVHVTGTYKGKIIRNRIKHFLKRPLESLPTCLFQGTFMIVNVVQPLWNTFMNINYIPAIKLQKQNF